ncbi:hypothetical protein PsorP6_019096 [Peronosclerospora sorghi]|nr:hypothetical protein PsorP6_019096 [Peronosclerospora sorghi]
MLVGASMANATGATMGAKIAVLRNKSIKFYAASMGSIFFLLSSTYIDVPFRGLQGATAGTEMGEAVVFGREQFHTWSLSKGVQRYQSKYGEAPAIDHRRLHC